MNSLPYPHCSHQGFPEPPTYLKYSSLIISPPKTKRLCLQLIHLSSLCVTYCTGFHLIILHLLTFHTETISFSVVLEGNYLYQGKDWITEKPNKPMSRQQQGVCGSCLPFSISVLSPNEHGWSAGIHSFPLSRESIWCNLRSHHIAFQQGNIIKR